MRTNVAIVLEGWGTWDSCSCSRRWFVCVCVCVCVRYPSYFSQALNSRRSLTVILPFGLFRCSWSASFGRPPRAACLSSRWGLAGSSWSILLQPRLLRGPERTPVCPPAWRSVQDVQFRPVLSAPRSQKAGQLGVLCSHEPRCPAAIQLPSHSPCWSCIHLQSQIKDVSRGPIFSFWFAFVVLCGRNSLGVGATSQSKIVFRFPWRGWDGSSVWLGAVCFLGLAFSMRHRPHRCLFFFLQMNMLMKLQEAANYPGTQSCDSDSTSHHEDILDSSLESTL